MSSNPTSTAQPDGVRRIIALSTFERLCGQTPFGRRKRILDPDYPPLVQTGTNRFGVFADDGAKYQLVLVERARTAKKRQVTPPSPAAVAKSHASKKRNGDARRKALAEARGALHESVVSPKKSGKATKQATTKPLTVSTTSKRGRHETKRR